MSGVLLYTASWGGKTSDLIPLRVRSTGSRRTQSHQLPKHTSRFGPSLSSLRCAWGGLEVPPPPPDWCDSPVVVHVCLPQGRLRPTPLPHWLALPGVGARWGHLSSERQAAERIEQLRDSAVRTRGQRPQRCRAGSSQSQVCPKWAGFLVFLFGEFCEVGFPSGVPLMWNLV